MKLKIDIKPEDYDIPLEQGYAYRWDRIALASIAGLLLLGLIGIAIFKLLTPDETEPMPEPTAISAAPSEAETPPRAAATESSPYFRDEAPTSVTDSSLGDDSENASALSSPTVSAHETEPAITERRPVAESDADQPDAIDDDPSDTAAQDQTAAADTTPDTTTAQAPPPPTTNTEPARQPASDSDHPFSGLSTKVHSDRIKRFVITNGVRDKEPVGTLGDITLNQNQVTTIYAYSEALNSKDDTLRYIWTLNGKQVAEVKVPVWSARWRSYSSKFVTSGMRGDWQVELRDQHGELLAVSEFQY